jgi:endonuclease-3
MTGKTRTDEIWSILTAIYPNAHIVLTYKTPWELVVAVILSAQCTDAVVNRVTEKLFVKYPTVGSFADAVPEKLEQDITSTGFYRNKAKHIIATARRIRDVFGGTIPNTMDNLLTLPGVARKTANVVLWNAFGKNEGIAVDTHVLRLSERLQLVPPDAYKNPIKTESELMKVVPQSEWGNITYRLIDHGRAVCQARKPRCPACGLQRVCPSAHTF